MSSGTSFPGLDGESRSGGYPTVCFSPDGRFTHDRTNYAPTPQLTATASDASAGGRYRIDGHAVRAATTQSYTVIGEPSKRANAPSRTNQKSST